MSHPSYKQHVYVQIGIQQTACVCADRKGHIRVTGLQGDPLTLMTILQGQFQGIRITSVHTNNC